MEWSGKPEVATRGRKACPPHGPHLVEALEKASYVVRCLACGVAGPEREDALETKLSFDETVL
jgi:hypothetical protein